LRAYNAAKCDWAHAGGAYSAPPDPLAGFKGPLRLRRGGEVREEEGGQGKGEEG